MFLVRAAQRRGEEKEREIARARERVTEGARRKFIGGESRDGTRSRGCSRGWTGRTVGGGTSVLRTPRVSRQQSTARDRGTRTRTRGREKGSESFVSCRIGVFFADSLARAFVTLSHVDACRLDVPPPACHAPRHRRRCCRFIPREESVSRFARQRTEMSGDARPGAAPSTCQARVRRTRRHQVR